MIETPVQKLEIATPIEEVPPILVCVTTDRGSETLFRLNAHQAYFLVRAALAKITGVEKSEKNPVAKRLAQLLKIAIKGVLLMYGDQILELALGKDHPRPGKKDDLVEWYTDCLAKIGIAWLVKHPTEMTGRIVDGDIIDGHTVEIDRIAAQPDSAESADESKPDSGQHTTD